MVKLRTILSAVRKPDIEKAKKDKESLRTDYFIIVSQDLNLPKKEAVDRLYGEKGLYGEKEGIYLVHPKIIVSIARSLRREIR